MKDLIITYNELIKNNIMSDKGSIHDYIRFYNLIFSYYRNAKNILEIGVSKGSSIRLWYEYFNVAHIYGIDIKDCNFSCSKNLKKIDRVTIYDNIDATNPTILDKITNIEFDIIIDDASHKLKDQIATFNIFYQKVKKDGLYIIEDVRPVHINNLLSLHKNNQIIDLRLNKKRRDDILILNKK